MSYIINRTPVTNLDKLIEFVLDGHWYKRRLVVTVNQARLNEEISIASPVGQRLANAKPQDQFEIPPVTEDLPLCLYVISVEETA